MGLTSTTYLKCDYVNNGKPCKRVFVLPDDPAKNSKGVEFTVSSKDANGETLFFCGALHLAAHWLDVHKRQEADTKEREKVTAIVENSATTMPEDLSLEN
jgi:hypothetical protein